MKVALTEGTYATSEQGQKKNRGVALPLFMFKANC